MAASRRITQHSGEVHVLADLFREWQIPPEFYEGISERWRCRIVPAAATEEEVRQHVLDGTPVLVPAEYGKRACDQVGDDALEYLTGDADRNSFPKPKIAFVAGWGRPGSMLADDEELQIVHSFQDVLSASDSGKPLNLQMFHRDDEGAPRIPKLPLALDWPLPDMFGIKSDVVCADSDAGGGGGGWGGGGGQRATGTSQSHLQPRPPPDPRIQHRCDMATRVSAKGALTWWHLDDGGEFVIQVGLPLGRRQAGLLGPGGKVVVKLFVFAARDSYDFICQDAETNKTHRFAHLDLFNTPTHWLPEVTETEDPLPILWVAPLEAGGRPLLSPPNVPHLVITCEHCVMLEQRFVFSLFLDEIHYFMAKAARDWEDRPIMYPFLADTLQNSDKVKEEVVPAITDALHSHPDVRVRARARESLKTLVGAAGKFFKVDPSTLAHIRQLLLQDEIAGLPKDKRAEKQEALMSSLSAKRLPQGVSLLPGSRSFFFWSFSPLPTGCHSPRPVTMYLAPCRQQGSSVYLCVCMCCVCVCARLWCCGCVFPCTRVRAGAFCCCCEIVHTDTAS
jgi:hypothetical protein